MNGNRSIRQPPVPLRFPPRRSSSSSRRKRRKFARTAIYPRTKLFPASGIIRLASFPVFPKISFHRPREDDLDVGLEFRRQANGEAGCFDRSYGAGYTEENAWSSVHFDVRVFEGDAVITMDLFVRGLISFLFVGRR